MTTIYGGFVYRWTSLVDGMMYIGSHNGSNPKYVGSGLYFRAAVAKYGIENFTREILYEGPNFRAEEERWLKAVDAANDPRYYNLKNEALGISMPGARNPMHRSHGRVMSEEERHARGWMRNATPEQRAVVSERMSGERNPMYGRSDHAHGLKRWGAERRGQTLEQTYGEEIAGKIRAGLRSRKGNWTQNWQQVECPRCGTAGRGPNMRRYHFDNCKGTAQDRRFARKQARRPDGTLVCPHCGVTGGSTGKGSAAMIRWHFDNCKRKTA